MGPSFAKAVRFIEDQGESATAKGKGKGKRKDRRKKSKGATMVYPAGKTATLRTHARHMELAQRDGPLSDEVEEYFGVKEGPVFLTEILPNLDIVRHICIDWMHNVCEGKSRTFCESNDRAKPRMFDSALPDQRQIVLAELAIVCVRLARRTLHRPNFPSQVS